MQFIIHKNKRIPPTNIRARPLSLSVIVQARRLSQFGHTARLPDKTDAKNILTGSPRRTGGDHQDALTPRGWRLSSRTWNHLTPPWMKQLTWLRITHSGDRCQHLHEWMNANWCIFSNVVHNLHRASSWFSSPFTIVTAGRVRCPKISKEIWGDCSSEMFVQVEIRACLDHLTKWSMIVTS